MNSKHSTLMVAAACLAGAALFAAVYLHSPIAIESAVASGATVVASSSVSTVPRIAQPAARAGVVFGNGVSRPDSSAFSPVAESLHKTGTSSRIEVLATAPPPPNTEGEPVSQRDLDERESAQRSAASPAFYSPAPVLQIAESRPVPLPQKLPLPLAFQEIDPVASGMTEGQTAALDALRQNFLHEVGGANQNPIDPRYAARWVHAQPSSDARLRAFFGAQFVQELQLQAAQADYAAHSGRR